jgi:hypothetical protein
MPTETGRPKVGVDMKDHDGIRGVAAVWIVIFHSFYYSRLKNVNLQGSTLMPLFFLLSGFSIAIGYNGRLFPDKFKSKPIEVKPKDPEADMADNLITGPEGSNVIVEQEKKKEDSSSLSPLGRYFYNRFIRVIPVYYICTCEAIPPTLYGYGNFDPTITSSLISSVIQSFIPTTTWTFFLVGIPLDGPGWTIATLYGMWICFPWLLQHFQQKTDEELLTSIVRCFWIQLLFIVILFPILLAAGLTTIAFWIPTSFPLCRLPVFIMGMNAGLLCTRHAGSDQIPWFTQSGAFLPWHFWYWKFDTCCSNNRSNSGNNNNNIFDSSSKMIATVDDAADNAESKNNADAQNASPPPTTNCCYAWISTDVDFLRTCWQQSMKLLFLTALWALLTGIIGDIASNAWFQGINVFAQLDLIVA